MTAPATSAGPDPATSGTPAVRLRGLGRRYGRQWVLRGVDLDVAAGRSVLLAGANGAGKTTLLKVIATRLRPSAGEGSVLGADLVTGAPAVRRRVAWASVVGGAYGALDGRENLRLAAALYGVPEPEVAERVDAALARVGLERAAEKPVRAYSSGMKKRLGLARLLLSGAPLWLLDEPFAALDAAGKALVAALLGEARLAGRTVLLASHEYERALDVTDVTLEVAGGGLRIVPRGGATP